MLLRVSDKISLLVSELGFMYCNCLLIEDDVRAIIDTGADRESLLSIDPDTVELVLYTHHHFDHTRGHQLFKNSQSFMHEFDLPATINIENIALYNSFDKWSELMPSVTYTHGLDSLNMPPVENLPWTADKSFDNNAIFDLGTTELQVIHTPGHSAGHSSFWFPEEDFLFTGDICLTAAGPWYGEIYADPGDMIESIDKLIALNPKKIASCHINSIHDDAIQRLTEFKNRIYKRDERIFKFLKKQPANIHELADNKLIYRYHPSPFVVFWEKLMLDKHLVRLEQMGQIVEAEEGLFKAK